MCAMHTTPMSNVSTQTDDRAKEQAGTQLAHIGGLVRRLRHIEEMEEDEAHDAHCKEDEAYHDPDAAQEAIAEDPLTVEVRSAWHRPSADDHDKRPAEYNILLCWGGPAVRIIGELDGHGEPDSARLEYQDWFRPWEEYPLTLAEAQTLIEYARVFSFGE